MRVGLVFHAHKVPQGLAQIAAFPPEAPSWTHEMPRDIEIGPIATLHLRSGERLGQTYVERLGWRYICMNGACVVYGLWLGACDA